MPRPDTVDRVVTILAVTVAIIMTLAVIGILLMKIMHPEEDVSKATDAVATLTGVSKQVNDLKSQLGRIGIFK